VRIENSVMRILSNSNILKNTKQNAHNQLPTCDTQATF
jgi:hypothetical protein